MCVNLRLGAFNFNPSQLRKVCRALSDVSTYPSGGCLGYERSTGAVLVLVPENINRNFPVLCVICHFHEKHTSLPSADFSIEKYKNFFLREINVTRVSVPFSLFLSCFHYPIILFH